MNIIVNGALGRMGQEVCRLVQAEGHTLGARVDRSGADGCLPRLADYTGPADAVIDFSNHAGVFALMDYCVARNLPLVAATTGYTEAEFQAIVQGAQKVPVFQSYNMSIGVALLVRLVGQAAAIFGGCDVEIVETHHNQKADAPSGTARLLLEAVDPDHAHQPVYGREGLCGPRKKKEIGVHALRGGTVAGTHTLSFLGPEEELELTHRAESRRVFAAGALRAAPLLLEQAPGYYTLDQLLFEGGSHGR